MGDAYLGSGRCLTYVCDPAEEPSSTPESSTGFFHFFNQLSTMDLEDGGSSPWGGMSSRGCQAAVISNLSQMSQPNPRQVPISPRLAKTIHSTRGNQVRPLLCPNLVAAC